MDKYANVFNIPPSSLLYFSEQLTDNKFAEKARVSIAKKVIKIMNWVSETESVRDAIASKST